jgi:hypothetical protein
MEQRQFVDLELSQAIRRAVSHRTKRGSSSFAVGLPQSPRWALALWVLVTPAGLKPGTVLEQNLAEPSLTQDRVEFSECQVRN